MIRPAYTAANDAVPSPASALIELCKLAAPCIVNTGILNSN